MNIAVGSLVWVEDPDVTWIDGKVVEVNGKDIKIICTNEKTVRFMFLNVTPRT